MRTRWIGTGLVVATGIALVLNAPRRGDEHTPMPQHATTSESTGREQPRTPARSERTHPVSLPAFAQREFNGRDLAVRIGRPSIEGSIGTDVRSPGTRNPGNV